MTGVWPLVIGLPTGSPGTRGTVSVLLSEWFSPPLDSSFFITAVVTLFSPLWPFLPSDSLIALNPPQIPLDILTSPFSMFPLEEEDEDFLLLKGAAGSKLDLEAPDSPAVRIPFELLEASLGGLFGSVD